MKCSFVYLTTIDALNLNKHFIHTPSQTLGNIITKRLHTNQHDDDEDDQVSSGNTNCGALWPNSDLRRQGPNDKGMPQRTSPDHMHAMPRIRPSLRPCRPCWDRRHRHILSQL